MRKFWKILTLVERNMTPNRIAGVQALFVKVVRPCTRLKDRSMWQPCLTLLDVDCRWWRCCYFSVFCSPVVQKVRD